MSTFGENRESGSVQSGTIFSAYLNLGFPPLLNVGFLVDTAKED